MTKRVTACLIESFHATAADRGFTVEAVESDHDHMHILVRYPPKLSISAMVNVLKGVSAHYLRKKRYPEVMQALHGRHFWSPSYYAGSCGGAPLDQIAEYVRSQQDPGRHRKRP